MSVILNEFFILDDTGITLYSWALDPLNKDVDLISGFLTALNMFAKSEKGESMRELTLDKTTFIFERRGTLIYVITSESEAGKPLLNEFLFELISKFTEKYKDEIASFRGNIAVFDDFKIILENCRVKYALDIIEHRINDLAESEFAQSVSIISKSSGELLFSKAKQYVDMEELGFLVPLVIKGGEMTVKQILDQRLEWLLLISQRNRVLLIEPVEKVFLVEEFKVPFEFDEEFNSKPKKVKNLFSNENFIPEIRYVKIITNSGKVFDEFTREPGYHTELNVDATMLINSARNFSSKYYKTDLKGVALGDSEKSTLFVPFKGFFVLVRGKQEDFKQFASIVEYIDMIAG